MHAIVDGKRGGGPQAPPWTERAVENFLSRAIGHAGMLCIAGPSVRQFEGRIYGIAVLAESHVCAHLDVMRGLAYTELFSCHDFDADGFVNLAIETFGLVAYTKQVLSRTLSERDTSRAIEPAGAAG